MRKPEVILMSTDAMMRSRIAAALSRNGHDLAPRATAAASELATSLEQNVRPLALVDLDPDPQQTLLALEPIIARFPETRFIALCEAADQTILMEAMQAGIRQVVLKDQIAHDLERALNRFTTTTRATPRPGRGHIVSVLSAGGGCGATTLAVNLARELADVQQNPTLLVDLDVHYGAVATYLNSEPKYGVVNVLNQPGDIDATLVASSSTACGDRLHLLASPATTHGDQADVGWDRVDDLLNACRAAYPRTVIDAPRLPLDVLARLVGESYSAVLVFQLSVKDLRHAREITAGLAARGISPDRLVPIVSRYAKKHQMITLDEAKRALHRDDLAVVRNDFYSASLGINYGKALAEAAPRSTIRVDLQKLAGRLNPASIDSPRI